MSRTWLVFRGLAREHLHWGEFKQQFRNDLEGDEIHFWDLPGAGEFRKHSTPITIKAMVKKVREDLKARSIEGPYHLMGVSLGGMFVLEWARSYPREVAGVVAINASTGKSPFYKRLDWQSYSRFFLKVVPSLGAKREKEILSVISNRKDVHEEVAIEWASINKRRRMAGSNVLRQLVAGMQFSINNKLNCPVLVLVGLGDRLVNPECSEVIHRVVGGELARHPWGGHDLTLDDGPWVTEKITNWLKTT